MGSTVAAQVQLKSDFTKQWLVPFSKPLGPLAADSVRVRTTVLSLTINNSAYAISGSFLSWWDTFPVPAEFPSPYNDRDTYGILSGWGFATVEDSNVAGLAAGTLLRGYFPLSSVPVDLQLKPAGAAGHFLETSPHRAKVMDLYQRYTASSFRGADAVERDTMAHDLLDGLLWECSYLLNRFSFAPAAPIMNPAGADLPWTAAEADLSDATVVCLAGSGKTALSLASELRASRPAGSGPRSTVAVTSACNTAFVGGAGLYGAVLSYEDALADGAKALAAHAAGSSRLVLLDFGARGTFPPDLHAALSTAPGLPITTIRVGFENKPYTPDELMADVFQRGAALGMVQMNTSPLREQAIATLSEPTYFAEAEAAKKAFFARGGIPGLRLKWYNGMAGPDGLEGAWARLCTGSVPPNEGIVVKL